MSKSPEYFQGAAAVAAGFTHGKKGKRRTDAMDRAHHRVRRQGIGKADFTAMVEKAEKRIR